MTQSVQKILMESVPQYLEFAKALISFLKTTLSEQGETTWNGRRVKFEIKPTTKPKNIFKGDLMMWYCKVDDVTSGERARADDYKSRAGALEHAVDHLAGKLRSKGILQ